MKPTDVPRVGTWNRLYPGLCAWAALRLLRSDFCLLTSVHHSSIKQLDVPLHLFEPSWIVSGEADGCAAGVEFREHLHQRLAALRVEIARGLVGQKDRRPPRNRSRH